MKKVENQAEDCKPISVALENYKKQNNEYPKALDSLGISNELKELCNYNKDKNGYIFALKGSDFNMQFYIYSSEQNAWYWD